MEIKEPRLAVTDPAEKSLLNQISPQHESLPCLWMCEHADIGDVCVYAGLTEGENRSIWDWLRSTSHFGRDVLTFLGPVAFAGDARLVKYVNHRVGVKQDYFKKQRKCDAIKHSSHTAFISILVC